MTRLAIPTSLLLLLAMAPAAKPDGVTNNTTITFSEFATGTSISDQYADVGILFNGNDPFITSDGANPTSPVLSGTPLFFGNIKGFFVDPKTHEPTTVNRFELDAGYFNSNASTQIAWFNAAGHRLGYRKNNRLGIQHFIIEGKNIAQWTIGMTGADAAGFGIDNVGYSIEGGKCHDERDKIIAEYKSFGVGLVPLCSNFTQSASSGYYGFSDLNTGNYDWALVRQPLVISPSAGYGLDAWTNAIGSVHRINSAYRNPARNNAVGGVARSRHVFGDAADLKNETRTEAEYDRLHAAAITAHADFIEPLTGPCKKGCVHADWRLHGGPYMN